MACAACRDRLTRGVDAEVRFVIGGVVVSRADKLRVTFVDGRSEEYPVEGQVLADAPQVRVFALPLGNRMYRRIEVVDHEEVLETADITRREIERMQCFARLPSPPGTLELGAELTECLRAANRSAAES
jgi:hypothetical protein